MKSRLTLLGAAFCLVGCATDGTVYVDQEPSYQTYERPYYHRPPRHYSDDRRSYRPAPTVVYRESRPVHYRPRPTTVVVQSQPARRELRQPPAQREEVRPSSGDNRAQANRHQDRKQGQGQTDDDRKKKAKKN